MEIRKILRNTGRGLVGLALLGASFGVGGCDKGSSLSKELETKPDKVTLYLKDHPYDPSCNPSYKLEVSKPNSHQTEIIPVGATTMFSRQDIYDSYAVTYCGMIGKDTFSLGSTYYRGGINFYFPVDSKTIECNGHKFNVLDVKPQTITLEHREDCPLNR